MPLGGAAAAADACARSCARRLLACYDLPCFVAAGAPPCAQANRCPSHPSRWFSDHVSSASRSIILRVPVPVFRFAPIFTPQHHHVTQWWCVAVVVVVVRCSAATPPPPFWCWRQPCACAVTRPRIPRNLKTRQGANFFCSARRTQR